MDHFTPKYTRRHFLQGLATGAASLAAFNVFAEERARFIESGEYAKELTRTPHQTEGPFFPDKLPLDKDNDLVIIRNGSSPAEGQITHLTGKILDSKGNPYKGAVIEIWQVDAHGAYLHSGTMNAEKRDKNFQGYGRFEVDSKGEYRFRTIKPVAYPGRPPHIHVKVSKGDRELLTTQCYIKGDPRNDRDGIIQDIRDAKARASLLVPFQPVKGSKVSELAATFNIVLGLTPSDDHHH
jgi:protocatechuate 3,4-dioxygenase, beta subunit